MRVKDMVVVVVDSNAMRWKWSVSKVLEVFPGSGGHVRNIKVKLQSAEHTRPVTKVPVIYPAEGYNNLES